MANSLFTGVAGLKVHQQMLDVVGNNLANTNTSGFKSQRVRFADLLYQTQSQATSATSDRVGGTNPLQTGLGVKVASVDANLQQGSLEATGNELDLSIQGNGFFTLSNGVSDRYSRTGAFGLDQDNFLVDPASGFRVQRFGTTGEGTATTPTFQTPGDNSIRIPFGTGIPGQLTSRITLQGNLSANAVGPLAQTLTTAAPLTRTAAAGGGPAQATTLLNDLTTNLVDYTATDSIRIQGTTVGGAAIDTTVAVGPATTVGDLLTAINANFPGSTAALDAAGNVTLTANATGPNSLNLILTDAVGNTGSTSLSTHAPTVTTTGKDGDTVPSAIQIFDQQGTPHNLSFVFQKQGNNTWDLTGSIAGNEGTMIDGTVRGITFNDDGSFQQINGTGTGDGFMSIQVNGLTEPLVLNFAFGEPGGFEGLTQFGGNSSAAAVSQDGSAAGFLTSFSVAKGGVISGVFSNGRTLPLAQLAIATFYNAGGLNRVGDSYFGVSTQSGEALIGGGLTGGRGSIQQGTLESSNVDVAAEFTRLIVAQRGFQVNARTITVSDNVLQELANIVR